MEQITSLEQLQAFFKANDKIKFCTKVFYVLQFVEKYPNYITTCGASWCKDGKHFISNAILLGDTLSIKPNTVNTNFRSHCFKIIPYKAQELSSEFQNLPDARNWKRRINIRHNFTTHSSAEEINLIPCQPVFRNPKENYDQIAYSSNSVLTPYITNFEPAPPQESYIKLNPTEVKFNSTPSFTPISSNMFSIQLPQEIQALLSGDQETFFNAAILMGKIRFSQEKKEQLALSATREWVKVAGNVSRADPNIFVDAMMSYSVTSPDDEIIRSSLITLIQLQIDETQQTDNNSLTFDKYFDFFLRYGPISKSTKYVNDLCSRPSVSGAISAVSTQDSQHFADSQSFCSRFEPWFQPSFNAVVSKKMLEGQPVNTWLLRPSSSPSRFTVHYKTLDGGRKRICATYIEFDPLAAESQMPFSVMIEKIGMVGAQSLPALLFDVMKLDHGNSLALENSHQILHSGGWNEQFEQESPLFMTPSQVEFQISSSQRYF